MTRRGANRLGWNVIGLALFVVMAFPVYWMVSSAFKPDSQIYSFTPTWFPTHPTLQHFSTAIHRQYFWTDVKNAAIVVVVAVVVALVIGFFAAVALAKYRFTGYKTFLVLVIGIQMIPQVGVVIPIYVVLARYHEINTLFGLILVYIAFSLPFCIWMLRGFVMSIPKELEEAAMVDGSTRIGAFIRILLPLVAPGLVATAVFAFITSWNEYVFARTLLANGTTQTITVWLSYFYGGARAIDWGGLMAASTLIAIPVVIFFLIVQRKIAFGLAAGAVKG